MSECIGVMGRLFGHSVEKETVWDLPPAIAELLRRTTSIKGGDGTFSAVLITTGYYCSRCGERWALRPDNGGQP